MHGDSKTAAGSLLKQGEDQHASWACEGGSLRVGRVQEKAMHGPCRWVADLFGNWACGGLVSWLAGLSLGAGEDHVVQRRA